MKHNKKRNVGLVYEFLTKLIAEAVVDGDEKRVKLGIKLLKKHFREGSELHREFRLFRALTGTYVPDRTTAERIVETSRLASRQYDREKLDREKSLLIRSINHTLKDASFYDKRIDEYKLYATVQTLLNEWRQPVPSDIVGLAMFEAELIEHLLKPKQKNVLDESRLADVDDLVVNLMMRRVEGKYKGVLSSEQLSLLNTYVCSLRTGNQMPIKEAIEKLQKQTLDALDAYSKESVENKSVVSKLNELKAVLSENIGAVDDAVFTRYLRIARVKQEILGS